jgi:hypothetical protein
VLVSRLPRLTTEFDSVDDADPCEKLVSDPLSDDEKDFNAVLNALIAAFASCLAPLT